VSPVEDTLTVVVADDAPLVKDTLAVVVVDGDDVDCARQKVG